MVDVQEDIIAVLDKAQTSTVTHAKLIKTLRPLHDQTDLYEFLEAFVTPLRAALVVVRKEPAVERVLDFAAKFAASVAPLESTAASGEEEEDAAGDEDGEEDKDEEATEDRGESDGGSEDRYTETEEEEEEKEELDENFFNFLLLKVLSFHGASGRAVRFRSCQLVAKMVKCAVERGCWLQSSVLEAVRDVMMERIRDKIPVVRVHAVQALELLQEDVSLQEELARLLERDPSPDVRRATLNTIVITDHTLPAIISRTRDVKEQIRKDAFWMLAEKCNIRNFRIEQRIKLLSDGLNDRSEIVREACVKGLLHSWSSNLNGDLLALLSKLDVESSSEVAEQALCRLLEEIDVGLVVQSTVELMDPANRLESWDDEDEERVEMTVTERVLPYDLLHSAEAFYWSCVCRYLHKMGDEGDQLMEKVLPTLSDFCVYVQQYVERELLPAKDVEEEMQKQFVCVQLLSVFSVMDLSDEVGRQRLGKMVLDLLILPGLPLALVSPLLSQQTTLWPQPHTRVEKLLEVIADLQQPSLSATLSSGGGVAPSSSSQSTSVDESQMNALSNLSLLDTHSDPDILARCLMIATEMLKEQRLRKLPVNLKTMVDVLVLPSIQSELPDIRDLAFCCLGLACLHDVSLARNHLLLFLQVSQVDHESVQATAVKVVFDLLLLFGFEAFSLTCPGSSSKTKTPDTQDQADETLVADGETKKITQKILATMADFLDGESPVLREISGEGLAKLLLSRRVISQKLLARLLVLWVDPSTDEEARLRAVLGNLLPGLCLL
ncbi:Condensin complex subunit 3 [Geodia barretti]|uniref:Condensin complex subunit 3 n=1 Tax=Geodia barretti TaxID=519541 RepID=A0AA35T4U5_GEOBA|nr:Condensin complex subunit 3 [Geodia barretti]